MRSDGVLALFPASLRVCRRREFVCGRCCDRLVFFRRHGVRLVLVLFRRSDRLALVLRRTDDSLALVLGRRGDHLALVLRRCGDHLALVLRRRGDHHVAVRCCDGSLVPFGIADVGIPSSSGVITTIVLGVRFGRMDCLWQRHSSPYCV